jgi:hypothetical protein
MVEKGKCPHCGSNNLRYVQQCVEFHQFELDQFPSNDGYIDLISLEDSIADDMFQVYIFCLKCEHSFYPNGEPYDAHED